MMRFIYGLSCLLIIATAVRSSADAQNSSNAEGQMVLLVETGGKQVPGAEYGDLFAVLPAQNPLARQTNSHYNKQPILSPDGRYIAYESVPPIQAEGSIESLSLDYDREEPSDIWLWDLQTGDAMQIADQPPDAQFNDAYDHSMTMRSRPVWSPNSQFLAWTELGSQTNAAELRVYDMTTGDTTIWADQLDLGYRDAGIFLLPPHLTWVGDDTLARIVFSVSTAPDPQTGLSSMGYELEFYEQTGLLREMLLISVDESRWVRQLVAVQHQSEWWLGVEITNGTYRGWQIIDPQTGTRLSLLRPPILQSVSGVGMRLVPHVDVGWTILHPDGRSETLPYSGDDVMLSPDGTQLLYIEDETAWWWRDGVGVMLLPDTADLPVLAGVWGAMLWKSDGQTIPYHPPTFEPSGG